MGGPSNIQNCWFKTSRRSYIEAPGAHTPLIIPRQGGGGEFTHHILESSGILGTKNTPKMIRSGIFWIFSQWGGLDSLENRAGLVEVWLGSGRLLGRPLKGSFCKIFMFF